MWLLNVCIYIETNRCKFYRLDRPFSWLQFASDGVTHLKGYLHRNFNSILSSSKENRKLRHILFSKYNLAEAATFFEYFACENMQHPKKASAHSFAETNHECVIWNFRHDFAKQCADHGAHLYSFASGSPY
jgi:hypothetical protein